MFPYFADPAADLGTPPPTPRGRPPAAPVLIRPTPSVAMPAATPDGIDVDHDIVACKLTGAPANALLVVGRDQVARYPLPVAPQVMPTVPTYSRTLRRPIERAALSPTGRYLLTVREGGRHGGDLWLVTDRGLVADFVPHKPLLPVDLNIADDGQTMFASTTLYQHHLFERPSGEWRSCFVMPEQLFVVRRSAFSPDGHSLCVSYGDNSALVMRKAPGTSAWQMTMNVQVGHDMAWIPAPSRLFMRAPANAVARTAATRHYVARIIVPDKNEQTTCADVHVGDESLFVCGSGEGFARVMHLHDSKQRGGQVLLKLTWFDGRTAPSLLDASLPGLVSHRSLQVDWPAPGQWLALYRKGGQRVRLIEVGAA